MGAHLIPRVVDIDLFHRREIRHRVEAVRAGVRVPQAGRDAPGDEFLPAFGAYGHTTRRVAPLARYPVSRRTARLTGRAPKHMKQVNISDPWYYVRGVQELRSAHRRLTKQTKDPVEESSK